MFSFFTKSAITKKYRRLSQREEAPRNSATEKSRQPQTCQPGVEKNIQKEVDSTAFNLYKRARVQLLKVQWDAELEKEIEEDANDKPTGEARAAWIEIIYEFERTIELGLQETRQERPWNARLMK